MNLLYNNSVSRPEPVMVRVARVKYKNPSCRCQGGNKVAQTGVV